MEAEDIMVTDVVTVRSSDTVGNALEILSEIEVRHLPVVDGDEIVGMLSDRDLRDLGIYRLHDIESLDRIKSLAQLPISQVMSSDLITVDPTADLREIIDLMVEERIGAVPVVDPHTQAFIGIISYVDVLRAAGESLAEEEGERGPRMYAERAP